MRSALTPLARIVYIKQASPSLIKADCRRGNTRQVATSAVLATERTAAGGMTVASPVAGLEPAKVWGFFEQLTKIPRPSKHEGR